MRVITKLSDDPTVTGGACPARFYRRLWRDLLSTLNRRRDQHFKTDNPVLHSLAARNTGLLSEPISRRADVLHLHWVGYDTVSIEEVGAVRQPLVWTLHDQWPFCGAEHYTHPPLPGESASNDERFALGYPPASRPVQERGPDLNRRTWLRKRRAWRNPMQIVCPSNWMADCVRRSALMGDWPISVIPYPIDLATWAPVNRQQARALLQLPQEPPLVLFGAMGGTHDSRKGADLLLQALQLMRAQRSDSRLANLELVIFGQREPNRPAGLGFPVHYTGRLLEDISLRLHYAAADVFVCPSRQDNLPNTALEAQACGTPVVAFRTGGLIDILDDGITGRLADPFDPQSLAAGIVWVLEDQDRNSQLGASARKRAETLWKPERVAALYEDVYQQARSREAAS